jgi:leader peptidase (prepilin peptidase)/N-methyltransferase
MEEGKMDEWQLLSRAALSQGWLFHSCVTLLGLLAGSFLNVVVYRLPKVIGRAGGKTKDTFNLCFPASHCPSCKHALRYWQNIPLLSWVILQGRCHYCHGAISPSYPLTEGFCAAGFLALSFMLPGPATLFATLILFWFLLALSLIDLATYLLPDSLTLPLLWIGLLVHSLMGKVPLQDAVYGAAAGYLSLWLLYWGVKAITGKEGMGYGDFKLLAALGAWVGWQMLPNLCILAALTGMVFVLVSEGRNQITKQIPFGPSLASAGLLVYVSQQSESVWLMFQ